MCYRYTLRKPELTAEYFSTSVKAALAKWAPRFNVALTSRMPVITQQTDEASLEELTFGFSQPGRTPDERPLLIGNARSETMLTKPTFREAVRTRRCLVPADGFYEWEKIGPIRRPHYFQRAGGAPFFFAGLWSPANGDTPGAFCIVTTTPNALLQSIHDRMPVMLDDATSRAWLGRHPLTTVQIITLCRPFPAEAMAAQLVTPKVNHARYEAPDCVLPYVEPPPEPDLFTLQ